MTTPIHVQMTRSCSLLMLTNASQPLYLYLSHTYFNFFLILSPPNTHARTQAGRQAGSHARTHAHTHTHTHKHIHTHTQTHTHTHTRDNYCNTLIYRRGLITCTYMCVHTYITVIVYANAYFDIHVTFISRIKECAFTGVSPHAIAGTDSGI